jgi:hypothetical protein
LFRKRRTRERKERGRKEKRKEKREREPVANRYLFSTKWHPTAQNSS